MTARPSRRRRVILVSVAALSVLATLALVLPDREGVVELDRAPGEATEKALDRRDQRTSRRTDRSPGAQPIQAAEPDIAHDDDGIGSALEILVTSGGRPVEGALASLHARGAMDPNTNAVAWSAAGRGRSNDEGHVRLRAVPGEYLLRVEHADYAPAHQTLRVASGEASKWIEIELNAGHLLTGRTVVAGGSREPVPLAELTLLPLPATGNAWMFASAPDAATLTTSSDPRGEFAIDRVAAGRYEIQATAVGHSRATKVIEIPSGPIELELKPAGVIEGFVVHADGSPAQGAEVSALGGEQVPPIADTGPAGGFSLEVPPGTYRVTARLGDLAGSEQTPIAVAPGQTVRDVRVTLDAGVVLEGRVVARSDGRPIADAQVAISPFREAGDLGRAVSDVEGRFRVEGLAPGSYDVVVWADGYGEAMQRAVTALAGQTVTLELELAASGILEGRVTDARGRPISGAHIRAGFAAALARPPMEARTDADGHFRIAPIDAGRTQVMARAEDTAPWKAQIVEILEGEATRADFELDAPAVLTGTVRTQDGRRPDVPVKVRLVPQHAGEGSFAETEAGSDGAFRLEVIAARYRVYAMRAEARAWPSRPVAIELQPGETRELDLELEEEEAGLSGRVLEPNGAPSPGAWVTAVVNGATLAWARCDDEGRFNMPALKPPAGAAMVLRARNGGRIGELPLSRPDGSGAVVTLRRGAVLEGRIVAREGGLPPSFRARARLKDGPDHSPELQFFGDRFRLDDVPAGPVRLMVRTDDGRGGAVELSLSPGERRSVEVAVDAEGLKQLWRR